MALGTPRILRGSSLAARSAVAPDAERPEARGPWVPPGRIVEICAAPDAAQTSTAVRVLSEAQAQGDPVAWIVPRAGPDGRDAGLFPPDLAAAGIDLDALVVVHVPADDASALARAAELVLRTGAFGAVVIDLGSTPPDGRSARAWMRTPAWQGRLLGLAREHACRVVVLSPNPRESASLGPLVSLRFDVRRARTAPGRFRVVARVVKDKLGAAIERSTPFVGPVGSR